MKEVLINFRNLHLLQNYILWNWTYPAQYLEYAQITFWSMGAKQNFFISTGNALKCMKIQYILIV